MNKLSIITVVYNGEEYLEQTIQSVLNQTYKNIEYIIIDGASTDGTIDIIKKHEDKLAYWVSEKDNGIYDAMNKGIDIASGDWINFMNEGDSFYSPDILTDIFNNKNYTSYNILYGDVETSYGNYKVLHKAGNLSNLYKSMQFSHQSTFFNTNYHKNSKYNTEYNLSADYLNIISAYTNNANSLKYLNIPVSIVNTEGISEVNIFKSVQERWKAVKYIQKNTLGIAIYYVFNLVKQYIKMKVIHKNTLNSYRRLKYKRPVNRADEGV